MNQDLEESRKSFLRCPLSPLWAIGIILSVLYVPQSWFFLMDYSWNDYHLFWLRFVPGLPVFFPVAMMAHPNEWVMLVSTCIVTALVGGGLYFVSRYSTKAFSVLAVLLCIWSTISAVVAYSVFRA
jgi:hypothetical protein